MTGRRTKRVAIFSLAGLCLLILTLGYKQLYRPSSLLHIRRVSSDISWNAVTVRNEGTQRTNGEEMFNGSHSYDKMEVKGDEYIKEEMDQMVEKNEATNLEETGLDLDNSEGSKENGNTLNQEESFADPKPETNVTEITKTRTHSREGSNANDVPDQEDYVVHPSLTTQQQRVVDPEPIEDVILGDSTLLTPCPKRRRSGDVHSDTGLGRFLKSLEQYAHFHKTQVTELKSGNSNIRTLSYVCNDYKKCAGIGDQFYRIEQTLILAMATDRVLLLDWDETSMKTFQHIRPNRIEWNVTLDKQTAKDYPLISKLSRDLVRYRNLLQRVQNRLETHIRISTAIQVPFLRGMKQLVKADKAEIFSRVSLNEVLNQGGLGQLYGEILRYLFTFSTEVFEKVQEAEKLLGISDKPYVAAHIRTGFIGTEYEEIGHFSKMKIFRFEDMWLNSINCSLRLAQTNKGIPLYLASDSYAVKELAVKQFGSRVKYLNMTLQHVAIKHNEGRSNQNGEENEQSVKKLSMDGYMATWVDFLLLARSDILVHSISGFSTVAGQFCSIQSQFYIPNCSTHPWQTKKHL